MKAKTICLTVAGAILLVLGAVGIFLPVLPTTPFVIMAATCFSGTPKLQQKIINAPFFGEYIENYKNRQGIKKSTIIVSLIFLWGMLIFSIIAVSKLWLIILLIGVGTAVTIHILWMSKAKIPKKLAPKPEETL